MFKSNVFFSKMALFEDSLEALAECLGISRQTLSSKVEGKSEFKRDEIDTIINRYNLTPEETHDMFFG